MGCGLRAPDRSQDQRDQSEESRRNELLRARHRSEVQRKGDHDEPDEQEAKGDQTTRSRHVAPAHMNTTMPMTAVIAIP